ncbi:hypothetical protein [Streptomyces sp. NBC_01276]|uniref:hypothetical protein n=1 Tax=Streptomyces sp. NBC_01276 TaxID=2903808 RepID=UPI00352C7752
MRHPWVPAPPGTRLPHVSGLRTDRHQHQVSDRLAEPRSCQVQPLRAFPGGQQRTKCPAEELHDRSGRHLDGRAPGGHHHPGSSARSMTGRSGGPSSRTTACGTSRTTCQHPQSSILVPTGRSQPRQARFGPSLPSIPMQ